MKNFQTVEAAKPVPAQQKLKMPRGQNAIHAYTDGSCRRNGRSDAAAGVGVYFGQNDSRNVSEPLSGGPQTNQRAELTAIKRALEVTRSDDRPLVVHSDSKYSMQCVNEWLPKWRENSYRTSSGGPVKNLDLILPVDWMMQERGPGGVEFFYVPGHSGHQGNEMADRLAQNGAARSRY